MSNGEVNRELQHLKRIFNLAIESGRLAMKPHIRMLREAPPRSSFFEPEQIVPWVFFRMVARGHGGERHPKRVRPLRHHVAWRLARRGKKTGPGGRDL